MSALSSDIVCGRPFSCRTTLNNSVKIEDFFEDLRLQDQNFSCSIKSFNVSLTD